ncbi:MAG: TIM barrel protein [Alphaproteobacteria bacterium]|nr:TIM barrel protein [Alphaproteobacteria bacterium]
MTTRRDVMLGGAALAVSSTIPAWGADRPQSPLGVAQTALGHYFRKQRGDSPNVRGPADPIATVDYVRSLGAGGVQMAIPLDTDIKKLRKRLDHHKMFFEGDIRLLDHPGADTAVFEKGLRMYKELGAPVVRTVCFVGRRYENFSTLQQYKDWKANALAVLDVCVPIADKVGIPLAMENHKDRVVDEEVDVLKKYSSANFGALVDFGNNISMCDDPVDVINKLAPYVKSCHMKNMAVQNYSDGFLLSEVLFEDGFLDIPAMWAVLKKANPKLLPTHELITRDPLKVPVLTDKYWVTWPDRSGKSARYRRTTSSRRKKPTTSAAWNGRRRPSSNGS